MFHKNRPTVLKALPVFLVRTNREPETLKSNFHFIRIFAAFLQYLMCVKEDFRNHCTPDNKQKLRASSCPSSWLIVENSANSQLKRALCLWRWWLRMDHANKSSAAAIMVFKNRGALSWLLLLWGVFRTGPFHKSLVASWKYYYPPPRRLAGGFRLWVKYVWAMMADNVALCRVEREQNDFTEYRTRINFSLFKLNSADQRVAQKAAIDIECNIMSLYLVLSRPR